MTNVIISNIGEYEGQEVTLRGWVYNKRSSGKIQFILIRDGTGIIQGVVFKGDVTPETFALADSLTQESSIVATGKVREDKRAPGGYELSIGDLQLVHRALDYPIAPKEHGVDFLMSHRHLWLRSSQQHAILRVRAEIINACRDYLDERGFTLIDAPILTPAACEGTTTLFETDYFGDKAYLSQSGQLYMEAAAMAFGRVYCFGPTFRAEKSKTRRHLMEFWMIEPEMAFADLDEDMRVQEEFVSYVVQRVLSKRQQELEMLQRDTTRLKKVEPPFPRISYDEAIAILRKNGVEIEWGGDFGAPDETILAEQFEKPVFVHRYPTQSKAFYMKPDPERPEVALCADLLAPEGYGEIIGGGQRMDDLEMLEKKIVEHNLPKEAYEWYLDLRRYGSVPHAGFGMGIERTVAWICGLDHVRETIPFARMLYRIYP
ncbi:MAG: asparagine--tRNA ligase [Chloroflexi bacterium]|nr:asparagine--tRNA ligase [Chloroflexota bacterium]MDA8186697.1 asparagine--tRNA ligase [Dehalococcoidales bacterium]